MKELQNIIHRHFEDPKQKKRYLAIFIALSMLVSFMVPLILMEPADSITKSKFRASSAEVDVPRPDLGKEISGEMLNNAYGENGNIGADGYVYSPAQMDLYTLLFGASADSEGNLIPQSWYVDCIDPETQQLDIDKALDVDAAEFFLGYASDFCAFIEGDFEATDADAEGRMFVGGDLSFTNVWNYQVGSGDYGNFKPMNETEEYQDIYGYASAIVGGKLYRIGTLSTGDLKWVDRNQTDQGVRHINNSTVFYLPEEGLYKSFVVGNVNDSLHLANSKDIPYTNADDYCNHDYPGENCSDCQNIHSYLENTNELAQIYQYDNVNEILEKTFDLLRMRSSNLGQIKAIDVSPVDRTLTLDASNIGDVETVYFNLILPNQDDDPYGDWDNKITNIRIIVPDERITLSGENGNDYSNGQKTVSNLDLNIVVNCGEQVINIDNGETHTFIVPSSNRDGQGYKISNHGKDQNTYVDLNHTNNHPVSSNILYNFYNAQNVRISGNFNGTILAPNADVTAPEACPGHLSGALISKSFKGGLEFGYRPYRGGNDILGMTSGYEIPLDKLIADTETRLPGAMFAIKDEMGNVISLFESDEDGNFVAIPSNIDFTGNTLYIPETVESADAERTTTATKTVDKTLASPIILNAYTSSDYNESSLISSEPINIRREIYLKANQSVVWEEENEGCELQYINDESQTLKITDASKAPFTITAKSKLNGDISDSVTINFIPMELNVTSDAFVEGTPINLEVINYPKADNIQYFVNGNAIKENTTENTCSYTPTQAGEFEFKVVVKFGGWQAIAEASAKVKVDALTTTTTITTTTTTTEAATEEPTEAPTGENGEQQALSTYSLSRIVNILDAENGNTVLITADEGKTIKNVKLIVEQNSYDYSLIVRFYEGDTYVGDLTILKSEIQNNNNIYYKDIDCPTDNITKIVIEAVTGAVKVKSYEATCTEPCKRVTKTTLVDELLPKYHETEILVEDWAQPLEKLVLNLSSNNESITAGGIVEYTLYKKIADNEYEAIGNNAQRAESTTNQIILNINKPDVAMVKIKAMTPMDIETCSFSTLKDLDFAITDESVPTKPVSAEYISNYTIVEQSAPEGFFVSDEYYTIQVKETLNLEDDVYQNCYPENVDVEITITKYGQDDVQVGDSTIMHFTVGYGQDEDGSIDLTKRIITHGSHDGGEEDVFTLTKNVDSNLITEITHNGHEVAINSLSEAKMIKVENGHKYYYNPETQLLTPMPAQSMTFFNAPGLLFKKVDDKGTAVTGVEITLTRTDGADVSDIWSWDPDTSEQLIDVSELETDKVYIFSETNTGGKYEQADPIYFKKTNDNKIVYGASETALSNVLDLINDREIRMVDQRIIGTKLVLKKFDEKLEFLDGAEFSLYPEDDENSAPIKEGIAVDNPNGIEVDLSDVTNSKYVENGYLKPGRYYLIETTIPPYINSDGLADPEQWYEDPGKISFEVRKVADGTFSVVPIEEEISGGSGGGTSGSTALTVVKQSDPHKADVRMSDGSAINISNVTSFEIVIWSYTYNPNVKVYISELDIEGYQNFTYSNINSQNYYIYRNENLNIPTFNKVEAQNWSDQTVEVRYVRIVSTNPTTNETTEYVFQDPSYTPASIADEPAAIDENGEETPNNVLEIINKLDDNERDVIVEKTWSGDTGFEAARPDVTFTLYQSETEITDRTLLTEELIYRNSAGDPYTITITEPNAEGKWLGKFEGLPTRYQNDDGRFVEYYYYIVETPVVGYTSTDEDYTIKDGGILSVDNELVPVSANVVKEWDTSTGVTPPESVTLQLQVKTDDDEWVDVEGKFITITRSSTDGSYTGTIVGLLPNRTYRFTDNVSGWSLDTSNTDYINGVLVNGDSTLETITVKNKPKEIETGRMSIEKLWQNNEGANVLLDQIYVKLYRKVKHIWPEQTKEEVMEDYARLLQYSLYFYDTNMCGEDVDEKSAISWRDECHTEDAIQGGFHDAGDHVMFGLTQGYAASMLGWGFYEFNTTVQDESKKVYDNLGQTDHMKLLTEYFCDFFVNSIRENNGTTEILVQKGDGDKDHSYWGPPEDQESRTDNMVWINNSGSEIAAEYAASLALAYLNFYDENADELEKAKYQNYLEVAKQYFEYSKNKDCYYTKFYPSNTKKDDIAWAAAWLELATGKQGTYLSYCSSNRNGKVGWNDVDTPAACAYAHVTGNWTDLANDTGNVRRGTPTEYLCQDNWGSARYNAMAQMISLVVAKNIGETSAEDNEYATWAEWQMNYLLGNNQYDICFVTGFAENSAENAHHRGASGYDAGEYDNKGGTAYKYEYDEENGKTLIGALVGGPNQAGAYDDIMDNNMAWQTNEVTLDYNAGLVGAAAGLYYFYETGEPYEIPGVKVQYLPDDEPALQEEETPAPQEEETPAPQAEEQPQDNNSTINNDSATAQQNNTGTDTNTSDASAQVAKLSSRFSNAFSILSVGFSRLATETVETHNLLTIVWNTDAKPNCSLDSVTFFYYDSSTGNITSQTLNNVQASEQQWWHEWNLQNIPRQNFVGISIESSGPQGGKALIVVDEWKDNSTYRKAVNVPDSGTVTWGTVIESNEPKINTRYSTIAVGDKLTLTYTGENPQWSVDRTDLADISNGELTAKAAGTVTVSANEATKVITIENLNIGGNQTMTKGQSQTLTINSINGLNGLSWTSSDTNVATVSYGVVNAQNVGSTVITATNNGITATFNITVNENSGGGVTTPNGYVLVHTENINELYATKTIYSSTPAELNGITVDYIIVEFSSNSNETYNGAFYINGTEESFTTDNNDNEKKYKVQNNILSIPIQNGVNINTLSVNCWWNGNNGNVARLENIYFYRLKADPTIVEITDEIRVGDDPIQLTATDFDGPVTWSIINGTDYAEINETTGLFKPKKAGTVQVQAQYGNQVDTIDITILPFKLRFDTGEESKEFNIHVGKELEVKFNVEEVTIDFQQNGEYVSYTNENGTYKFKVTNAANGTPVIFNATANDSTAIGTINVLLDLEITSNDITGDVVYTNRNYQLNVTNNVGNVTWSITSGSADITSSGLLTPTSGGVITVLATDEDGTTKTFTVNAQIGSATVNTDGMEQVIGLNSEVMDRNGIIKIEKGDEGSWKKTIENLPIVDANGDYYTYYIVECDELGNEINNSNPIKSTDGTIYLPLSYTNGTMLDSDTTAKVFVSNAESGKVQGQMPSAGGVGRKTYYFFGGMIMLLSAAGYTCTRRRQSSRRAK